MIDYLAAVFPWYLLTVAFEAPWIILGIQGHSLHLKIIAAFALTAFTYPFVAAVFPLLIPDRAIYVGTSELFAPVAEALLFLLVLDRLSPSNVRKHNAVMIIIANVFSFAGGELLKSLNLLG